MKRVKFISAVVLLVLLLAATILSAPRMIIPESSFDFGYAPQNAKITHVFWVKSPGTDSLKILKVVPG